MMVWIPLIGQALCNDGDACEKFGGLVWRSAYDGFYRFRWRARQSVAMLAVSPRTLQVDNTAVRIGNILIVGLCEWN